MWSKEDVSEGLVMILVIVLFNLVFQDTIVLTISGIATMVYFVIQRLNYTKMIEKELNLLRNFIDIQDEIEINLDELKRIRNEYIE